MRTAVRGWSAIVVEDDRDGALVLEAALLHLGAAEVRICRTVAEGIRRCAERLPDLITVDMRLPDRHGFELIQELHGAYGARCPPIVILSATPPRSAPPGLVAASLLKPYGIEELRNAVLTALHGQVPN